MGGALVGSACVAAWLIVTVGPSEDWKATRLSVLGDDVLIGADHLVHEARDERLAMILDAFEARRETQKTRSGYHALEPTALYMTVEEWEIAVLHRDHRSNDGACVRATWFKAADRQLDRSVDFYREAVLPDLAQLEGFCSASLLIDRLTGRSVSSVSFNSREAMDRNREQARSLRANRIRELGADQLDVGEFELALAHLRVPELV